MRRKNNDLVAVANDRKLGQRFKLGVPKTFDQDCSSLSARCLPVLSLIKRTVSCLVVYIDDNSL